MNDRSYPLIDISRKTLAIMKFIGNSQSAVSSKRIESEFDMRYSTVMAHLATLEVEGLIAKKEGGYIPALELAKIWALKKAQTEKKRRDIEQEYKMLSGDESGAE